MKLGLFLPHIANPVFEQLALKAETLGFASICCDDHLMSSFEPEGSKGFGCYESLDCHDLSGRSYPAHWAQSHGPGACLPWAWFDGHGRAKYFDNFPDTDEIVLVNGFAWQI